MGCIVTESSIVIPLAKPYPAVTPNNQSQNQQYQNKQSYPNQVWSPQNQQPYQTQPYQTQPYQTQPYQTQPYQTQPNYSNNGNPQGQTVWQNQQQPHTVNQNYQQKRIFNSNPINNPQMSNIQITPINGQNVTQKQKPAEILKNNDPSPIIVQGNDKKQKSKNPSNPNLLNIDQVSQLSSLPDHNQFLVQLQKFINSIPQLTAMLTKDFFSFLFKEYQTQSWSTDSKQQFITILLNYIKFTSSQISQSEKNETKYQLKNFGQNYGRDMYKIFNSIKMKNFWVLQTLDYEKHYKKKSFQLDETQILKLVNQVRNLCANNTQALVYLSHYLLKCCQIMDKKKTPPSQINVKLKSHVTKLKQMFSPKNTLQQQQKYRSYQKDQLGKIPSMDVPYKKKTFVFKTQNKEEELNGFIMEIVEMGKKHFSTFTKLTSQCCLENQGFGYKSNLKLKQSSQTMQLLRVKQKLLGNFINEYYNNKTYDCKSLSDLRVAEIAYLEESLKNVYSKMDQVQFIVTDILRGKCMFNKVSHINAAAQAIMKTVEERSKKGENIQVVSIDNRLMKITTDLMLRIRIDEIVCEFQIALKFNQAQNEIHHKMYEVERSKAFSPVTMLFNWHQSISNEFFASVDKVLQKYSKKEKDQISLVATNLKKIMQYKTETKAKVIGKISKKDFDYFNRIKAQIKNMKNPVELSKNIYMRTGICFKQMKKYKEALDALFKHKQKQPRDLNILTEIGSVYNKQAAYRKAHQNLFKYFKQTQKLSEEVVDMNRFHRAIIDLAQANFQIGKNNAALQFLKEMQIEFETKYFGVKSKEYAKIISLKARGYSRIGNQKQSQNLFQQAIAVFEKAEGKDEDPNYPQSYRLLGQLYISQSNPSRGLEYLNKALSLSEGMFGKESIESAIVLMAMGTAYQKMEKFEEAQQYLNRYAHITSNLMTKVSMEYATAYFYFSMLYQSMNKEKQAFQYLQKCRKLTLNLTGSKSNQYLQILNNEANIYLKFGMKQDASKQYFQAALKLYFQALQISVALCNQEGSKFTNTMATLYSNIALCYQHLKNMQSSLQYLEKNVEAIKVVAGPESLPMAQSLVALASSLVALERYQQALQYLEKSQTIYKKNQTQNQGYYTNLQYQALCLCKLGSVEQSMELYLKLVEILKGKDGKSVKYAILLVEMYDNFSHMWGVAYKKQLLEEVLMIYKHHKHPEQEDIRMTLQNLQNNAEQNQEYGEQNGGDGDPDEDADEDGDGYGE